MVALGAGRGNVWLLIAMMAIAAFIAVIKIMVLIGRFLAISISPASAACSRACVTGRHHLESGSGSREVLWLTALFGVAALPASAFPFVSQLWPRQRSNSNSGCGTTGGSGMWRRWVRRRWWRVRRLRKLMPNDRVGIGWRPELAAGIFDALDQIDVLEVIADNYVNARRQHRRALKIDGGSGAGACPFDRTGARRAQRR